MVKDLIHALNNVLLGKQEQVEMLVMALLADGHVLIEDVPGTGKTTIAKALAAAGLRACSPSSGSNLLKL